MNIKEPTFASFEDILYNVNKCRDKTWIYGNAF